MELIECEDYVWIKCEIQLFETNSTSSGQNAFYVLRETYIAKYNVHY